LHKESHKQTNTPFGQMQTFCIQLAVGLYALTTKPERVIDMINKTNLKTYETLRKAANIMF